jgi:hypothetical protein
LLALVYQWAEKKGTLTVHAGSPFEDDPPVLSDGKVTRFEEAIRIEFLGSIFGRMQVSIALSAGQVPYHKRS